MTRCYSLPFFCLLALILILASNLQGAPLRILYFNDFHGFAEPYIPYGEKDPKGGIAWLAAEADFLRQEKPTLFLVAGYVLHGHNWANLSQGRASIELFNLMGIDALVAGNHEFDYGLDVLGKRIEEADFPVLGANVEGLDRLRPYVIRMIGGVRVTVLGVVTEDTPVATHPRNVAGLTFRSPTETVSRYIEKLRQQVDVLVVLSHLGYGADRALAEKVAGIDVIVGGHSHTRVDSPTRIGETLVVQAWEHGKVLGVLDLDVQEGKIADSTGRLVEIGPGRGEADKSVLALVDKYGQEAEAALKGKAGKTKIALDGEGVRQKETNLGNLVADIMREAAGADGAILNGGSIRASIPAGPIRVRDVYAALPFDNYIVAVRLKGSAVRQILEHGVSRIEANSGAFPQVSGFSFVFDPKAPCGSRVTTVWNGGEPLNPEKEYIVATSDFLAAGGDGYTAFGEAVRSSEDFAVVGGVMKGSNLVYSDAGRWLRDVVIDRLRIEKKIKPTLEQRIMEVKE